uniref:Partner of Y14 and mago n=1 Tax=Evadne anonyx TaxID=141404 RepID=A0A9N6WQS5_9CRUS|nr:EOG090X0KVN [Evadne anonyx]
MAGIGEFQPVRTDTGDLFLPASRRPDGTWRKPRRVKEGYVPQEEVPVYESKGKQWAKSQPAYPVGMSPAMATASAQKKAKDEKPLIPGLAPAAAKQTNKKKKNSEKKAKVEVEEVSKALAGFTITEPVFKTPAKTETAPQVPAATASDPAKRLKNLKKKLKDIEALESKVKKGELKNPDKDQLEKIKRKKEVAKEIQELETIISDE